MTASKSYMRLLHNIGFPKPGGLSIQKLHSKSIYLSGILNLLNTGKSLFWVWQTDYILKLWVASLPDCLLKKSLCFPPRNAVAIAIHVANSRVCIMFILNYLHFHQICVSTICYPLQTARLPQIILDYIIRQSVVQMSL